MELVYLWVEKYKNIYNQGFNFSPRFHCDYNEEQNELTIKENDDYIENFFGKNINVTAIVGKNGSGKSSVLDILEIIWHSDSKKDIDLKYLLIYKIDNQMLYQTSFNLDIGIQKEIIKKKVQIYRYLSEVPYFSCYNPNHLNDFSIYVAKEEYYVDLSILNIGKIFSNKKYRNNSLLFEFIPKSISIKDNNRLLEETKEKLQNYLLDGYDNLGYLGDDIQRLKEIVATTVYSYDICLLDELIRYSNDKKLYDIIRKTKLILKLSDSNFAPPYTRARDNFFINLYNILKEKGFSQKYYFLENLPYSDYLEFLINTNRINNIEENESFNDIIKYKNFLIFDFKDNKNRSYSSLSHGEKIILGQIINFKYKILNNSNNNFIFFIDEPDIGLHPNWQKKYVNILVNILSKLDINIHIILTSHSPFLLSDIPKQNIIFLDKDERGNCKVVDGLSQTFGANIHTLLSDSFFMEDGLMGEFAKNKIRTIKVAHRYILHRHKRKTLFTQSSKRCRRLLIKQLSNFWQIQEIIGEPFLQKIVKNQLEEMELILLGKKEAIDNEIARLQALKASLR